jgi:glutamyl-Q tRNA(Asp) synthetase
MSGYRGRFAPTPSGPLHFGSIVAALGSRLEARTHGGQWRVRIDDLDPPRVLPGAAQGILRCLEALGFEWDGEVLYQSRRRGAYHAALHRLREAGLVYPCSCSRRDIAELASAGADGPIYPGTCRRGPASGRPARALRVRVTGARVGFEDGVLGPQDRDWARGRGFRAVPRGWGLSFHLASAVDDAEQGITHVVRGADLLESSARQIWLIRALGLSAPRYAHLPVVLDASGQKLSKQSRAAPVDPMRPAAALWPALRFLGQDPPAGLARAAASEIWKWALAHWRLERVPRRASLPIP